MGDAGVMCDIGGVVMGDDVYLHAGVGTASDLHLCGSSLQSVTMVMIMWKLLKWTALWRGQRVSGMRSKVTRPSSSLPTVSG